MAIMVNQKYGCQVEGKHVIIKEKCAKMEENHVSSHVV